MCFAIEVEYHIYRGWNMIAVPCSTDAETIDEIFPFLISTFVFDPAIQSYDLPSGVPAANEGFWAFSLVDTHITIECECVDVMRRKLDIVFCVDTSGSMLGYINSISDEFLSFYDSLLMYHYDCLWGLVEFEDGVAVNDYDSVTFGNQMTNDIDAIIYDIYIFPLGGGADIPEQSLDAISDAINLIDWRPDAEHIIIGLTDAYYCQAGDTCPDCHSTETDSGIASLIESSEITVFWATTDPIYYYSTGCATCTEPVPTTPYWDGTGHLGWYQYFCCISGGKWYDLSSGWEAILNDIRHSL